MELFTQVFTSCSEVTLIHGPKDADQPHWFKVDLESLPLCNSTTALHRRLLTIHKIQISHLSTSDDHQTLAVRTTPFHPTLPYYCNVI